MAVLYELAVLGAPSDAQVNELEAIVRQAVDRFGLRLGHEVAWSVRPAAFNPDQKTAAAAVFFGAPGASEANLAGLLRSGSTGRYTRQPAGSGQARMKRGSQPDRSSEFKGPRFGRGCSLGAVVYNSAG